MSIQLRLKRIFGRERAVFRFLEPIGIAPIISYAQYSPIILLLEVLVSDKSAALPTHHRGNKSAQPPTGKLYI